MRRAAPIAMVAVALLATASAGQAAQRFAAPSGEGEVCTLQAPCGLKTAIVKANTNDEVIVTGGTYPTAESILAPEVEGLDIHGDFGGPMPTVTTSTAGKFLIVRRGASLSYLEIVDAASVNAIALVCVGSVDRVRVIASGASALAAEVGNNCKARDSVLRADGAKALAVFHTGQTETALMRNVTAIATGPESIGVSSRYQNTEKPGAIELDLKNVIARGEATDLLATGNAQGSATIVVSNSNFATTKVDTAAAITAGAGNQTAAPLFVNAAGGDYREAAGSPTIDAGVSDQLGPLDLAGNARVLGSAPDIGAYEFAPLPSGGVRSISIKPRRFGPWPSGGPIAPRILKSKPPKGAEVTYTLTGPATVEFSVSRKVHGRKVGKTCKPKSHANAGHRRCAFYVPVKGAFTQTGAEGADHFVFSGRIGGRPLRSGDYKLTARAGHLVSAAFEIGGRARRSRVG